MNIYRPCKLLWHQPYCKNVKKSLSLNLTWILMKRNTSTKEEKEKVNNDQQIKKDEDNERQR